MLRLFKLHIKGHPFSRSYGVNLPSSLTIILPLIFGFSPCLPVSVCGTGTLILIVAFLDSVDSTPSLLIFAPIRISAYSSADLPTKPAYLLKRTIPSVRGYIFLCPHFSISIFGSTGISTSYPSPTPLGLSLGPDLPWEDEPSSGILRLSMGEILTHLSLLMPAFSLLYSPRPLTMVLLSVQNAPLPIA